MALSINKNSSTETWSIPVHSNQDPQWEDNTWLVEHLRQLADRISEENPRIYAVGVKSDLQYGPHIEIEVFTNQTTQQ